MIVPLTNFFYILSIGFLFSGMSFFYKEFISLQYLLYTILFILSLFDFLLILKKKEIIVKRIHEKYISIGVDNSIKILIENKTLKNFNLKIRDEYPAEFSVKNETIKSNLKSLSYLTLSYYVKPFSKGEYTFLSTYIRVIGKLNLVARQYKYKNKTDVKVYPNLVEVKKCLNLVAVNRLEQSGYKKKEHGGETEFDFLREYQNGDDYKSINWKASAKKHYPITKIFQKEYNRNIISLLDTGRMMTTKYGYLSKLDFSIDASLILAAASKKQKDNYGLLAFSNKVISFLHPSAKGNKVLTNILSALYNIKPSFDKTDYNLAYKTLKTKIRKNSCIFIFSELYNKIVSFDLIRFLKLLSNNHKVNFISFEEVEKAEGGSFSDIAQWTIQQDQIIEKELIIKDLKKRGINVIRVNAENIKQKVIKTYLGS